MHDHGFGLIGPHQVHAVYTMYTCKTTCIYTGTSWRVTSSISTLYRCYMYAIYVQFNVKVGGGGHWQLSTVSHPPSGPFVQYGRAGHRFAPCQAVCRLGGCGFLRYWSRWCLWLPSCALVFLASMWSNVILCWERLDLRTEIHRNGWGSHESVFCKFKTLNSQCLGPKTVMSMCTIRGKDSRTVLRYYIDQPLSTGPNSSFH